MVFNSTDDVMRCPQVCDIGGTGYDDIPGYLRLPATYGEYLHNGRIEKFKRKDGGRVWHHPDHADD